MRKFVVDGTATLEVKQSIVDGLNTQFAEQVSVTLSDSANVLDARAVVTQVTLANAQLIRVDSAGTVEQVNYLYAYRYVWVDGTSSVDEVLADIDCCMLRRDGTTFTSTRGSTTASDSTSPSKFGPATFLSVVRDGLANDGGLYLPTTLRPIPQSQWTHLVTSPHLTYHDVAQIVLERLVDPNELPPGLLESFISQAYHRSRWADKSICPLTDLLPEKSASVDATWWDSNSKVSLLELYHGPTAAFKDFALQLFPYFFGLSTNSLGKFMILAATSGDTGVAAIVGFLNSAPDTKVMVLYPEHGVSPVQKIQMQSCDDGKVIRVFGVASDFDFCQTTVKHIFQSSDIEKQLETEQHLSLSSANSINFGRLIPQVVYYAFAYRELVQQKRLTLGDPFDVCVPCGNFGNILSCLIAKKLGLPVRRLVVASNVNDVLSDFIRTGVYDISQRSLHVTASPSIDILKASNIERLLYFLSNGDTQFVSQCMKGLEKDNRFELPPAYFKLLQESFTSERCTEEECFAVMKEVYDASNQSRLLDPHTGVAVFAARAYLAKSDDKVPLVVASTAHWAKFPEPVLRSLKKAPIPAENDTLSQVRALHRAVGAQVHPALQAAVEKVESMGNAITERKVEKNENAIVRELFTFAAI